MTEILVFIFGTCYASFLTCITERKINNIDYLLTRSYCNNCHHTLEAYDLMPILSYVINRGKCRYCKKSIPVLYPLFELFLGIIFFGLYKENLLIKYFLLVTVLFSLAIYDYLTYTIPDIYNAMILIYWLITSFSKYHLLEAFLLSFCIFTISQVMQKIEKKEVMGMGDIKLIFVLTLILGFYNSLLMLLIACLFSLLILICTKKKMIAFGPSLSITTIIILLFVRL